MSTARCFVWPGGRKLSPRARAHALRAQAHVRPPRELDSVLPPCTARRPRSTPNPSSTRRLSFRCHAFKSSYFPARIEEIEPHRRRRATTSCRGDIFLPPAFQIDLRSRRPRPRHTCVGVPLACRAPLCARARARARTLSPRARTHSAREGRSPLPPCAAPTPILTVRSRFTGRPVHVPSTALTGRLARQALACVHTWVGPPPPARAFLSCPPLPGFLRCPHSCGHVAALEPGPADSLYAS